MIEFEGSAIPTAVVIAQRLKTPLGSKELRIAIDAAGKKWIRFAAWDSAGNGAFTQPVPAVVSQFQSGDWKTDLWLLVTPTMRRADSVQPHLRATSAQAILKNVGGRFAAWQNLSTD